MIIKALIQKFQILTEKLAKNKSHSRRCVCDRFFRKLCLGSFFVSSLYAHTSPNAYHDWIKRKLLQNTLEKRINLGKTTLEKIPFIQKTLQKIGVSAQYIDSPLLFLTQLQKFQKTSFNCPTRIKQEKINQSLCELAKNIELSPQKVYNRCHQRLKRFAILTSAEKTMLKLLLTLSALEQHLFPETLAHLFSLNIQDPFYRLLYEWVQDIYSYHQHASGEVGMTHL